MGYKTKVRKNVEKAFTLVQDLADTVTLSRKTVSEFNFTLGEVKNTKSTTLTTKAIITEVTKQSDKHNSEAKNVMLKTHIIGNINAYDKMTYNGESWTIGPIINSDQYVTVVTIYKEG